MPVKLSEIPGVMINKKTARHDFTEFEDDEYKVEGFNHALSLQSEVCIGLNRESLSFCIWYSQQSIGSAKGDMTRHLKKEECDSLADAIIAQESTLIESKGRNGEKV